MSDFLSKVAVVIGAGAEGDGIGNGRATAILLARRGAYVACVDRDRNRAARTAEMITAEGGHAKGFTVDAADPEAVSKLIDEVMLAEARIDVLVNVVGIPVHGNVVEVHPDDWDRAFQVNLKTALLGMKYVIPHMQSMGGGSIVNISSIASIRHLNVQYSSYYSSKAALNQLSRTAAIDFAANNVRINTVIAGMIDTPHADDAAKRFRGAQNQEELRERRMSREARVPLGRLGTGWDIAKAAVFLASSEAEYITGAELVVDGGVSVRC